MSLLSAEDDENLGGNKGLMACVALFESDKIRLIDFSPMEPVKEAVEKALRAEWKGGIQKIKKLDNKCYSFKLKGNPWSVTGESVGCRQLLMILLRALASVGWHLYCSTDLSYTVLDQDTLIFVAGEPKEIDLICFSMINSDKLRVIGGESVQHILPMIRQAIIKGWSKGIQSEGECKGFPEFKLKGNPWVGTKKELTQAKRLAISLLATMKQNGT